MKLFNVKHRLLLNYAILKCTIMTAHNIDSSIFISHQLQSLENDRHTNTQYMPVILCDGPFIDISVY